MLFSYGLNMSNILQNQLISSMNQLFSHALIALRFFISNSVQTGHTAHFPQTLKYHKVELILLLHPLAIVNTRTLVHSLPSLQPLALPKKKFPSVNQNSQVSHLVYFSHHLMSPRLHWAKYPDTLKSSQPQLSHSSFHFWPRVKLFSSHQEDFNIFIFFQIPSFL